MILLLKRESSMENLTNYFHTQHMFVASTLIMVWICAKATKGIFIKARKVITYILVGSLLDTVDNRCGL